MFNFYLSGNLTEDPKTTPTTESGRYIKFTVAVNHGKEDVSFVDCSFYQRSSDPARGELILNTYKKGKQVTVSGYAKKNRYQKTEIDDNGVERAKWINDYQFTVRQFTIPPKDKSEDMLEQEKEKAALPF